ncbi:MAG: type II toxin-antitoxin system prevent-host-death family antitoxin [Parachlamydia sp.]|jgi:prevent-host-death family protein|nr:type II toxin-antitoxin system prevent-host-death family antitoxin [Parachlamydia sp.]
MKHVIQAGKFKAECLKILDEVEAKKYSVIITKRNKPIAKLVPLEEDKRPLFGRMKGTAHITGDIIEPIGENWDACS